jgi:hypothetical protein
VHGRCGDGDGESGDEDGAVVMVGGLQVVGDPASRADSQRGERDLGEPASARIVTWPDSRIDRA